MSSENINSYFAAIEACGYPVDEFVWHMTNYYNMAAYSQAVDSGIIFC